MRKIFSMYVNNVTVISGVDDIPNDESLKTHRGKVLVYRVEIPTYEGRDINSDIWYPGIFDGSRTEDIHIFDGDQVAYYPGSPACRKHLVVYRR